MLTISDKAIIDNWSLEQSACILDNVNDSIDAFPSDESFIQALGGLSNFINSILLYDETKFIANGFQTAWHRFEWFSKNIRPHVLPYIPSNDDPNWNNYPPDSNSGAIHYLLTSKALNSDLFVSPDRARHIIKQGEALQGNDLSLILDKIDNLIQSEAETLWVNNTKAGIRQNFILPSFTQYVFSQASSIEDLFTVIMQMKSSNKIGKIREHIEDISKSSKNLAKLQNEIDSIIKGYFGKPKDEGGSWSINLDVLFFSVTKSFNLNVMSHKQHLTFLKDVVACRSEAFKLRNDTERLFKRKIDFT